MHYTNAFLNETTKQTGIDIARKTRQELLINANNVDKHEQMFACKFETFYICCTQLTNIGRPYYKRKSFEARYAKMYIEFCVLIQML